MPLKAGTRIGAYEATGVLGAGSLPESFATNSERLARFQREAEVLASLNHPNIAAIHGLEESKGIRALVMEPVEGYSSAPRLT